MGDRGAGDPLAGRSGEGTPGGAQAVKLFLCGDVMTGRGIDQILPQPSSPEIYESYLTSAEQYVEVAEQVSGPIPRAVDYDYVWGDALPLLRSGDLVRIQTDREDVEFRFGGLLGTRRAPGQDRRCAYTGSPIAGTALICSRCRAPFSEAAARALGTCPLCDTPFADDAKIALPPEELL